MNKKFKHTLILFVVLLLFNALNQKTYQRFDMTKDKRYTLSDVTVNSINTLEEQLIIKVYLEGDFPSEFKRLQIETRQFLEELNAENPLIRIQFVNPDDQRDRLVKAGMYPSQLTVEEDGKLTNAIIFPWAEILYMNKIKIVSLFPDLVVQSQEEQLETAVENLEYAFISSIEEIINKKQKHIAILTGNGELSDIQLYSFLSNISKKYRLSKFTLDSVNVNTIEGLNGLQKFDLAIIAKPTEPFSEKEKLVLDQFIINGGKTLWMFENTQADTDSLTQNSKMIAYPRDLNLTDFFFSYGVRINTSIVQDLYASKIPLATGNIGNKPQFKYLKWFYHPLVGGNPNHPITKNILPIRLRFANQIDTLQNSLEKTPLLVSSLLTKKVGTPALIELQSIANEPKEKEFTSGYQLFGVLIEGKFTSMYANRIQPFEMTNFIPKSQHNKMIVISDGDVIRNQMIRGKPSDLSQDKWTGERFGNKEFLLNATEYLLDDNDMIQLRNKTLQINLLDKQKAYKERFFWQIINVLLPLVLLFLFGIIFRYFRKRQYC